MISSKAVAFESVPSPRMSDSVALNETEFDDERWIENSDKSEIIKAVYLTFKQSIILQAIENIELPDADETSNNIRDLIEEVSTERNRLMVLFLELNQLHFNDLCSMDTKDIREIHRLECELEALEIGIKNETIPLDGNMEVIIKKLKNNVKSMRIDCADAFKEFGTLQTELARVEEDIERVKKNSKI